MANRLKPRAKNGVIDIRAIVKHKMETGLRKDKSGNVIPADYITKVTISNNGKKVLTSDIGSAVSRDPYFRFKIKGDKGDEITLAYIDNHDRSGVITAKSS